jgi:hypothetical protein
MAKYLREHGRNAIGHVIRDRQHAPHIDPDDNSPRLRLEPSRTGCEPQDDERSSSAGRTRWEPESDPGLPSRRASVAALWQRTHRLRRHLRT